ncbi:MAG: hypothetical protein ACAI35_23760 [Candidatus Methylacidiphilales bacterium]
MARNAQEWVVGEIRREIADGSVVPDAANELRKYGVTMYQPLSGHDSSPVVMGRDPALAATNVAFATIVKVSAANMAVRPGGTATASGISITEPSANGRSVSRSRWFGTKGPGLGSQNIMPTWYYQTRGNGIQTPAIADASNPAARDYVLGRFAFTVYDLSGRMNANVVGCPTVAASQMSGDTSLARINLNKVDAVWTTMAIDKLMSWRNGTAAASGSAYKTYVDTFAKANGFATIPNGHNAFLTRRDLLNAVANGILPSAADSLTAFSCALAAPSWGPTDIAGSTIDYRANANDPAGVNRFIPNVRHPADATIKHYKDDGTFTTYTVQAGESLIRTRFSLARLAWITPSGPKTGMQQAIKDCFGLEWDAVKWRWDYVAAKAPPGVAIKTLEQVALEKREPNFFELLNAGILKGSLGRDPGKGCDTSIAGGVGVYSSFYDQYKTEANLQLMQIGANIFDQYDADSYPTAIHFDAFGLTKVDDLIIQTVYGIENLPYLLGLLPIAISDPVPPAAGSPGVHKTWMQPQVWNPHEIPTAALPGYPASFRAYAYGRVYSAWNTTAVTKPLKLGPMTTYDDGTGTVLTPGRLGEIYFNNPADNTSPFYNNPLPLTLDLLTSSGLPIVDKVKTPKENYYDSTKWDDLAADNGTPNKFAGFSTVGDPAYNPDPDPAKNVVYHFILPDATDTVSYSLQYLGPDGVYHPYNFMGRMAQSISPGSKMIKPGGESNKAGIVPATSVEGSTVVPGWGPQRLDPRTDRFSSSTQWWGKNNPSQRTMYAAPSGGMSPPQGSGAGGTGCFSIPYLPGIFTYTPLYDPTTLPVQAGGIIPLWSLNDPNFELLYSGILRKAYYADQDGVVRYGDSYRQNIASGDGIQTYHGTAVVTPDSTLTNPKTGSVLRRRPVVLNRPFRSVGELAFAHRDLPFKTLDFWSPRSADAALLDLFAIVESPQMTAGHINPNTMPAPVMKAVFTDAWKNQTLNDKITDTEAQRLSTNILTSVVTAPYANRADLATLMGPIVSGPTNNVTFNTTVTADANWANKSYVETPVRSLADVTQTRTWNFLIDVVAQTGKLTPGASDLSKFIVEGERRYWLSVAIDRYTGKVVSRQLEPVYDND